MANSLIFKREFHVVTVNMLQNFVVHPRYSECVLFKRNLDVFIKPLSWKNILLSTRKPHNTANILIIIMGCTRANYSNLCFNLSLPIALENK